MAGDDDCLVGESEETVLDGADQSTGVATREIGTADAAGEQGVAGKQERLVWEVKG